MDRVRTFGLAGAGGIFVVATVVVALGSRSESDVSAPEVVPRGLVLGLLFTVPAIVALLGVRRRDAVLLAAAGLGCLAPAWLSVATLPLVIPALLLLVAAGSATTPPGRPARWLIALAIVGLQVGALVALFGTTEDRCWLAYRSGDGYVYRIVPSTAVRHSTMNGGEMIDSGTTQALGGPGQPVAGGCDGGALTERGAALAGVLTVGALAIAFGLPKRRAVAARSGG